MQLSSPKNETTILWAWALFLFLSSLALRFYRIEFQSLWLDELCSASLGLRSPDRIVAFRMQDYNPPGYDLVLHALFRLLPATDLTARALSAVAGSFTPVALLFLGRRMFGLTAAGLAGTLLAFNPAAVAYGQEARPYALLTLLAVLYFSRGWRVFREEGKPRPVDLRLAFLGAALAYLHYSAVLFLLAAQVAWLWPGRTRRNLVPVLTTGALTLLLFAPWLPTLLVHSQAMPDWTRQPLPSLLDVAREMGERLFPLFGWLWTLGIPAFAYGVVSGGARRAGLVSLAVFSALFLSLVLVPTYARGEGVFLFRHVMIVQPFLYLALAQPFSAAAGRWAPLLVLPILLLSLADLKESGYYQVKTKEEYREAAAALAERNTVGSPIAVAGNGLHIRYYLLPHGQGDSLRWVLPDDIALLKQASPRELWLIEYSDFAGWKREESLPEYRVREEHGFRGVRILRLERKR